MECKGYQEYIEKYTIEIAHFEVAAPFTSEHGDREGRHALCEKVGQIPGLDKLPFFPYNLIDWSVNKVEMRNRTWLARRGL